MRRNSRERRERIIVEKSGNMTWKLRRYRVLRQRKLLIE